MEFKITDLNGETRIIVADGLFDAMDKMAKLGLGWDTINTMRQVDSKESN